MGCHLIEFDRRSEESKRIASGNNSPDESMTIYDATPLPEKP